MSAKSVCGRLGARGMAIIGSCVAIAIGGMAWLATSSPAQDTGGLPLPTEIELGGLPSLPGLTEGIPNLEGIWTFNLTDHPGSWFDSGIDVLGTKSLGVTVAGLGKVRFVSDPAKTDSNHTASSLLWPTGAKGMPFDQEKAWKKGQREVELKTPGLYAFVCKMHPFMLGAVIKDDPTTVGLDFGKSATYARRQDDGDGLRSLLADHPRVLHRHEPEELAGLQRQEQDPDVGPELRAGARAGLQQQGQGQARAQPRRVHAEALPRADRAAAAVQARDAGHRRGLAGPAVRDDRRASPSRARRRRST